MTRLPGPRGPGATLRFLRAAADDPCAALESLRRDYGDVVQIGIGRWKAIGLFGADANELILVQHPEWFEWGRAMKALIPVDGPTALVVTDGPDHHRRRKMVQPGFHRRRIDGYLGLMIDEADQVVDSLTAGQIVDAYAIFRVAVRRTVILALFGEALRGRADELGDALAPALDFVNLALHRQIRWPGEHSGFGKARRARENVDRMIDEEIERRVADDRVPGDDVLSELLSAVDEQGEGLSRAEIRDQVVSLIAAGYDTTSAAMGWMVWRVFAEPQVVDRLRAEIEAVVGDRSLLIEHLRRMPYVHGVVNETLRLHPPGVVSPRTVVEAFEFRGHRVPRGALVVYSAYLSGRDPSAWPDVETFRPERWTSDAEPGPTASWVPFGGGVRRCLGFAFATLELEAMLVQLVRRVSCELVDATLPRATGIASVRPVGGVPIRVRAVRSSGSGRAVR